MQCDNWKSQTNRKESNIKSNIASDSRIFKGWIRTFFRLRSLRMMRGCLAVWIDRTLDIEPSKLYIICYLGTFSEFRRGWCLVFNICQEGRWADFVLCKYQQLGVWIDLHRICEQLWFRVESKLLPARRCHMPLIKCFDGSRNQFFWNSTVSKELWQPKSLDLSSLCSILKNRINSNCATTLVYI